MTGTHTVFPNTTISSYEFPEDEFLRKIKREFSTRYKVESLVASEMALDLYEILQMTKCDLREIKSYITQ